MLSNPLTRHGVRTFRIRTFLVRTGFGSYQYFGFVKLYKQGKNIFKIELLHIFKWIFPFFQIKKLIIQISEEIICLMWKNCWCLNWFLVGTTRIRIQIRNRIRFFKLWFAGSGSGLKWTGSATLLAPKQRNEARHRCLNLKSYFSNLK